MFSVHFLTGTSAPAPTLLKGGEPISFYGLSATNNETTTVIYLKIFNTGNTNTVPVLGTSTPALTIAIPANGIYFSQPWPLALAGASYYAVTKLQADTDATALSTGGEAVTLFLE